MSYRFEKIRYYGPFTYLVGSATQISGEAAKIILGAASDKFPNGFDSLNLIEESIEGGLPALLGATIADLIYKKRVLSGQIESSPQTKLKYITSGAVAGYCSMAFVAGPMLHVLTGEPDVKWGPFS